AVSPASGSWSISLRPIRFSLKKVPQRQHDAAAAAVGTPLVQEIRRADGRVRNAEVARVGRVVKLRAELQRVAFGDAGILEEAQVEVPDAVGAQDVAAKVAKRRGGGDAREQTAPSGADDFFH